MFVKVGKGSRNSAQVYTALISVDKPFNCPFVVHSVLQHTLTELKEQQRKFEEWNQLQEKIVSAQATVGQRLRSQLEYQQFRIRTTKTPPRNISINLVSCHLVT